MCFMVKNGWLDLGLQKVYSRETDLIFLAVCCLYEFWIYQSQFAKILFKKKLVSWNYTYLSYALSFYLMMLPVVLGTPSKINFFEAISKQN